MNRRSYVPVAFALAGLLAGGCAGPPPPPPPTPEAKVAAATAAAATATPRPAVPTVTPPPTPAPPIPEAKPKPAGPPPATQVEIQVITDKNLNPDQAGRPSPVVLRLYELKALKSFTDADYFAIIESESKTLGADLVAYHEVVPPPSPQQTRKVQLPPLKAETRYLGVVAEFRDVNSGRWRAATAVPLHQTSRMQIHLKGHEVSIGLQ